MNDYHFWHECQGNKFVVNLSSQMLSDQGYLVSRVCHLVGESKKEPAKIYLIKYDKEYVKQKLQKVFHNLKDLSTEQIEVLLDLVKAAITESNDETI